MAEAKRDQNRVTGLMLEDDTTGLPVPALRDSSGRLKTIGTIADDTSVQKIIVSTGGTTIGTRKQLNFIEGTHINFTGVDNAGSNRVDLTIESTVFDATVGGTGDADYTTVKAAVDAGHARIMVMTSTTETANIDIVAATIPNLYIYIKPGATIAMGAFRFTDTGSITSVTIEGGGTISYAHTSVDEELFDLTADSKLFLRGVIIDNNSSAAGCALSLNSQEHLSNVRIELPNLYACGIYTFSFNSTYTDVTLVGGGSACREAMFAQVSTITGLILSGVFITDDGTSATNALLFDVCAISNLILYHSTNVIKIDFGGSTAVSVLADSPTSTGAVLLDASCMSSVYAANGYLDVISCSKLSDAILGAGLVDTLATDANCYSNVNSTGLLDLTDTGSTNNSFTNCRFTTALTVAGDRNKFTNCDFLGGASVSSGADNNGFTNCQFGADAGGGALTITVVAGSNNTRIVGCMTDAAISDAGTGTVMAANTIY